MLEARRTSVLESQFGLEAAARLVGEGLAPWLRHLGLLVERVEPERPRGAPAEWHPGAVVRLPYTHRICRDDGLVCSEALTALADTALLVACAATWNGYKSMMVIDRTMHFMRAINSDVVADARIVRLGRSNSFGRVTLMSPGDARPVAMVSSAYAMGLAAA